VKTIFANLDKINALLLCMIISGVLAYFISGKNFYIVFGVAGVIGVFAAFEIRKAKPSAIGRISSDIAGNVAAEAITEGFFSLLFRCLFAIIIIIFEAIIP